jgi:hypothetical protein
MPAGELEQILAQIRPHAVDAKTYRPGAGDRMDLGLAVDALLAAT